MAEKVGELYYSVTLDTGEMIAGQRRVQRELDKTASDLASLKPKLTATAAAVAALAGAYAALKLAKLADEFRLLGARVEIAAGGIQAGADAMRDLIAISQRTATSLAGNAEVFQRLNQSILQMGGTQRDTLQITELLGKAIKVSGASATEAKSAMLQFGQALGSGKLQGDELRSLMENAPYLMKQLADGIGVPVGALKDLGEQGRLTSDVVTNALVKAADKIDQDFKKVPLTIEAALTVAQDQAGLAALKFDELTGSSATLAGVTKGVGEVLDALALQFGAATTEADKLGRSNTVQSWADSTVTALSYVADAGDFVVRVFKQAGLLIGGLLASSTALLAGEAKSAKMILEETFNDIKANSDRMYAGRKIRQRQEALASTPEADRLDRMAAGGGRASSKLSAPVGGGKKDTKKTATGKKFDSDGYLADLEAKSADAWERIDIIEQEPSAFGRSLRAARSTKAR